MTTGNPAAENYRKPPQHGRSGGSAEMALVGEFLYRLDIVCDSLLHRNERFTSGGVLMAAAIEVLAGEEIDVDISARTQADADELAVGQKHGRHLHLLDRQGVVHEALAVPLLELRKEWRDHLLSLEQTSVE